MSELSPQAREILEAGRDGDDPTAEDRKRVRGRLARSIAAGAIIASGSAVATSGAAAATSVKAIAIAVVTTAVVTSGVVIGVTRVKRDRDAERPAPVRETSPAEGTIPAEKTPDFVLEPQKLEPVVPPEQESAAPRQAKPPKKPTKSKMAPDTLQGEILGLREAHAALQAEEPERALGLIDEQNARFPKGQMQEERAAARILALCALERFEQARRALRRFERAHSRSPMLPRLREACAVREP